MARKPRPETSPEIPPQPANFKSLDPLQILPTPSRWQFITSSVLLSIWILFLAWIALTG